MTEATSQPAQATKLRLKCPHCGQRAQVRKSETITPTYREGLVECMNAECGWRGKLTVAMTETFTPSLRPNPGISLPLSPEAARRMQAALERYNAVTTATDDGA